MKKLYWLIIKYKLILFKYKILWLQCLSPAWIYTILAAFSKNEMPWSIDSQDYDYPAFGKRYLQRTKEIFLSIKFALYL